MDEGREYSFCDTDFFQFQTTGQVNLLEKSNAEFSDSSSESGSASLPSTPEKCFLEDYHRQDCFARNQSTNTKKKSVKSQKERLMSKSDRKNSEHSLASETSSEEGYYTSTSPENHITDGNNANVSEFNKHSKLPPIAHHDEAIERPNTSEDEEEFLWNSNASFIKRQQQKVVTGEKIVEPLGLSPRLVFQNTNNATKAVDAYVAPSRQWPPPKSPAYSKRPQFKGLATLAGSMNNLAAIPEMDQELIQMRPLSRKQQQSVGGSWDNVSALIQSDSFQIKPKKAKPHYVAPMDLSPRLSKALGSMERGHSFSRECSKDNKWDMLKETDVVPLKQHHLVRENSTLNEASLTSRRKKTVPR